MTQTLSLGSASPEAVYDALLPLMEAEYGASRVATAEEIAMHAWLEEGYYRYDAPCAHHTYDCRMWDVSDSLKLILTYRSNQGGRNGCSDYYTHLLFWDTESNAVTEIAKLSHKVFGTVRLSSIDMTLEANSIYVGVVSNSTSYLANLDMTVEIPWASTAGTVVITVSPDTIDRICSLTQT